jgi:hypothetical protein
MLLCAHGAAVAQEPHADPATHLLISGADPSLIRETESILRATHVELFRSSNFAITDTITVVYF